MRVIKTWREIFRIVKINNPWQFLQLVVLIAGVTVLGPLGKAWQWVWDHGRWVSNRDQGQNERGGI